MKHKSEQHAKWHRRVEGQVRDCMMKHPRWFSGIPKSERKQFIESLAKRIVGEILAAGPTVGGHASAESGYRSPGEGLTGPLREGAP